MVLKMALSAFQQGQSITTAERPLFPSSKPKPFPSLRPCSSLNFSRKIVITSQASRLHSSLLLTGFLKHLNNQQYRIYYLITDILRLFPRCLLCFGANLPSPTRLKFPNNTSTSFCVPSTELHTPVMSNYQSSDSKERNIL